jgi:hypothetical protein
MKLYRNHTPQAALVTYFETLHQHISYACQTIYVIFQRVQRQLSDVYIHALIHVRDILSVFCELCPDRQEFYDFLVGNVYCKCNTSEVKYYIFSVCVIESNLWIYHYHYFPPWIRSSDLFWHRRVAIVSCGYQYLFFLEVGVWGRVSGV